MEQRRAAGLLEDLLGERERLDGILNTNDRFCFKLNENKLSEEYIEVTCVLPLERFIFICLCIKEEGREIERESAMFAMAKGLQTVSK